MLQTSVDYPGFLEVLLRDLASGSKLMIYVLFSIEYRIIPHHTIRVFPIFTSVDITVYQYGKNVLYFFYNIAQRTLTEKWREIFRVDIELYQHGS